MLMNGSVIDSNVLIKFLQGDERAINALEGEDELFIPSIVMGELLYGVEKSKQKLNNYVLYSDFLAQFEILPVDKLVAETYAVLKAELFSKGINTPENDLWIAATARANGLGVLSFDKHFEEMGLI